MKIIQLLMCPDDPIYQGCLLGLGDDGVVYTCGKSDRNWRGHITTENHINDGSIKFEKMSIVDICALDNLAEDKKASAIDDAIHLLEFERRLLLLTDKQRQHMMSESAAEQQQIAECKTDQERDEYITANARTAYFRRLAKRWHI